MGLSGHDMFSTLPLKRGEWGGALCVNGEGGGGGGGQISSLTFDSGCLAAVHEGFILHSCDVCEVFEQTSSAIVFGV